jgi:PIN domain nuclease of toxin-antitoxin system
MTLLLDTHYVFALAGSPGTMSSREKRFLNEYPDQFFVSAVSIWEIRLKWNSFYRSGDRKGPASPNDVLNILATDEVARFLPLTPAHAALELDFPLTHRDPFDDLLLVQAQAEGLKLLSRDRKLADHPLVMRAT